MSSPGRPRAVLVTGATGFLGRRVMRALAAEGESVVGVSRGGGTVEGLVVDPLDLAATGSSDGWRQGKPRLEAVVHLAASIPSAPEGPEAEEAFVANLRSTRSALRIAEADQAAFVYASGTSVYGSVGSVDGTPVSEAVPPSPGDLYTLSKSVGEELVELSCRRAGIRAVVLRVSAPYGPGQHRRTVVRTFLEAALHSQDITFHGTGARVQDFTHVDDVVEAVRRALRGASRGVFNVCGGEPLSMRDLAELARSVVAGSTSRIVASGQEDAQEGYRGRFANEKAKRELGWVPRVHLSEGLARWAREIKAEAPVPK